MIREFLKKYGKNAKKCSELLGVSKAYMDWVTKGLNSSLVYEEGDYSLEITNEEEVSLRFNAKYKNKTKRIFLLRIPHKIFRKMIKFYTKETDPFTIPGIK